MEMLEDRIKTFVSLDDGDGSGDGYDDNSGSGSGDGSGSGSGSGSGDSYDDNSGYGDGWGDGYGYSSGSGDGYGLNNGVKEVNGDTVYIVNNVPTIFKFFRDNIAQGFILQRDLTLKPCYIVKEQNKFAHGDTLHDAFTALQEKLYDDSTEEERIETFRNKFPDYDTPYSNRDLFDYHHVLTGSCRMGRESFCQNKGIDLNATTTVREFIELTKDSYESETICKLPVAYEVK